MCEKCDDRVYVPVVLRCKSPELAQAFCTIITARGASAKHEDGSEFPPYVEGDKVIMPWMGHPKFVNAMTALAMETKVAEVEDVREMSYGATAQGMEIDVENVRAFGEKIATAMGEFMALVGSSRPVDVTGIMETLDTELKGLQSDGD